MTDDVQLFAKRRKKQKTAPNLPPPQVSQQQQEEVAADGAQEEEAGPGPSSLAHLHSAHHADTFKALGLTDWLVSVCSSLGMTRPTHVQQGCVPEILAGRDVIGLAQTGSGKTAAFALPILQKLAKDPYGVFALVLIPTR